MYKSFCKGVLALVAGICLAAGFAQTSAPDPLKKDLFPFLAHPWPMRHADPARTGQSPSMGATTGEIVWKFQMSGTPAHFAVSKTGMIVVGDEWVDAWWSGEDFVTALDSFGGVLWRRQVPSFPWGMSQSSSGAPAVDADGNPVVPTSNATLQKFDTVGNLLWSYSGNNQSIANVSPAILPDTTIRWGVPLEGTIGFTATGTVLFTGAPGGGTVSVAPNGDMALGLIRSKEPHTFPTVTYANANGTNRWTKYSSNGGGSTVVFSPDGTLFVCEDGFGIRHYDPNGNLLWSQPYGVWTRTPALGKNNQLYVPTGVFMAALEPQSGAVLWTLPISGVGSMLDGLALDARDIIYATTDTGYLIAFRPTGSIWWMVKICDKFTTSPVIGPYGRIIAAGREGTTDFVYCVR